jgi:chromobox protein 1
VAHLGKNLHTDSSGYRNSASIVLEEYFASIGGREKLFEQTATAVKGKKRGRAAAGANAEGKVKRSRKNGIHPSDGDIPASLVNKEWKPPSGSWELDVDAVDMFRDESGTLMVYLTWKNGQKTQHSTKQAYMRCPQKVVPSITSCK